MEYDYQLKYGELKVKVIAVETWSVKAIRYDNGEEVSYPIHYFKEHFKAVR
jgi:hypothetical protein